MKVLIPDPAYKVMDCRWWDSRRPYWVKHSSKGHISKHKTKKEANQAIPMLTAA